MAKINAAITGVGAFLPDYVLTNEELSRMVDTTDEWITTRVGIKERRILKGEGQGNSVMATEAVKQLLEKTNTSPDEVELMIVATVTPDRMFPATANIVSDKTGIKNAFSFDMNGACSGFVYAISTGAKFIESGQYKKVIVVGSDKMSAITDYQNRSTCPLFGDAASAVMLEPTEDNYGVIDSLLHTDGIGRHLLYQKAGGSEYPASHETVENHEHYIYQEGRQVFKYAVERMADVSLEMMKRHNIAPDELNWLVPHQANLRIIKSTAQRMGIREEQVMINIQRYGNTTAATIPLCLWEWEDQLNKGDNLILTSFGAGFTWGAVYVKWAY